MTALWLLTGCMTDLRTVRPPSGWICSPPARDTGCLTCLMLERGHSVPPGARATVCRDGITLDEMPGSGDEARL